MIPLCRHILPAGLLCNQAAVKNTLYCRHHSTMKQMVAQCQPSPNLYGVHTPLPFVFPEDRAAVQLNFFLVLQALNDRRIDIRTANTMNRLLRSCQMNLGKTPLVEPNTSNAVDRVILTPEGEEIAPPREQLEEDEAPPVHGEDCPCRKCAEQFRGAAPEQHHADCRCGLCGDSTSSDTRSTQETISSKENSSATVIPGPCALIPASPRTASAQKLYDKEPAKAEDEDIYAAPSCKKVLREYEARQVAIEAGLIEPFKPEPFGPDHPVSVNLRRHEEIQARIERNKQIGKEIWERRFAHLHENKEKQQISPQSPTTTTNHG